MHFHFENLEILQPVPARQQHTCFSSADFSLGNESESRREMRRSTSQTQFRPPRDMPVPRPRTHHGVSRGGIIPADQLEGTSLQAAGRSTMERCRLEYSPSVGDLMHFHDGVLPAQERSRRIPPPRPGEVQIHGNDRKKDQRPSIEDLRDMVSRLGRAGSPAS